MRSKNPDTYRFSNFKIYVAVCLLSSFASCTHQRQGNTQAHLIDSGTPLFNNVIDKANRIDQNGDPRGAVKYLDSAYYAIRPANIIDQYQYYYNQFNIYNRRLHEHEIAGHYADTMLMLVEKNYKKLSLVRQYALANFSKGDVYFAEGNYNDAYVYYYRARTLAENNLDSCELQDYNYRLAMVLYRQEHYNEAAENFKTAFEQSADCEHTFSLFYRRQELLDNAALAYFHIKSYDSALLYFHKALAFIDQHIGEFPGNNTRMQEQAKAVIYGNMASVLQEQGKIKEAEGLLKNSIQINSQKNFDNHDAQLTRLKLASLYFDKGDIQASYSLLQQVKTILDTLPAPLVESGWYDMMWKYYNHEKQPQKALEYLLKYNEISKAIAEQNRALTETDIKERIKNLDRQYHISILVKNNELKKYYLIITSLITLVCLTIALFVFVNLGRTRRNLKVLTALNDKINKQNAELESVLEELEESNHQKDRILRTVAHDVRNPIAAISALSDLLLAEHDNYTDEQKEMLSLIQNACSNTLTLTRDILESAHPSRREEEKKEHTGINALLSNGVELLRFRASEKRQKIDLELLDEERILFINKEQVWRVISNLITNAIKFSNEDASIKVKAEEQGNNICISVHDDGIGIPDMLKDKIFDTFTNAKREGTAGEKSFGLGLSISRQIMEMHGGRIWFDSEPGKGTTFYVSLPLTA